MKKVIRKKRFLFGLVGIMLIILISFVSPLTPLQEQVKQNWIDKGVDSETAHLIAIGKSDYVEPIITNETTLNETELLKKEERIKDNQGLLFFFILFIIMIASLFFLGAIILMEA